MTRHTTRFWAAFIAALTPTGGSNMARSIEEPAFELVYQVGKVEIRQYEPSIQAV